jgi:hypothetical protein
MEIISVFDSGKMKSNYGLEIVFPATCLTNDIRIVYACRRRLSNTSMMCSTVKPNFI